MFATRNLSEPIAAGESLDAGARLWTITDGLLNPPSQTNCSVD
jgi:hypothetical protein